MLNYGYGALKSQIRSEIIAAGLDPSVGIIHGNDKNRNLLVSDLMEPLRPEVDRTILEFAHSQPGSLFDLLTDPTPKNSDESPGPGRGTEERAEKAI